MARSKWISFAAQHALSKDSQKAAHAGPPVPLPAPAEVKRFGLENFGNTCYANSVLQALYFCTPFRDLMLQASDSSVPQELAIPIASSLNGVGNKPQPRRKASTLVVPTETTLGSSLPPSAAPIPPSPPTLFSALRSLFINISTQPGDKGTVAPKAFIEKLKELNDIFRSTMHQDAHEFLNYLLNKIVEEMEEEKKQQQTQTEDLTGSIATLGSKVPSTLASSTSGTSARDATLVHKLFEGVLTSETRCLTCETVSSRDESFLDLSIDIEQNSSVTACLRQFSASEMLSNRNKFFCDSCCDLQEAEKRMKIKKLPNVLALHLKRFKYQEDLGRYIKLTYRVAFPMDLRLFNTVDDMEDADRLYHLFAIVVHIGNGPHHGHYISIIKNGGTWLVFDDDNVSSIPESDIPKYFGDSNSGSAYVLYYQADDIDLVSLGVRPPESPTPPPVEEPAPVEIPSSQSPHTLAKHLLGHPPGLEPYDMPEKADSPSRHTLTQSHLISSEKPSIQLSPVTVTVVPESIDQSPSHTQTHTSSPSTARFGAKWMNTIRRAPSTSMSKANLSASSSSATESRKHGSERSPRLSASSPALSGKDEAGVPSTVPPVPPLPTHIQTASPSTPPINGEEKERSKEKPKSGGWFIKRKSVKVSDNPKTLVETSTALPPSPNRRAEDQPPTPSTSNWLRPFGSSQRDSQTLHSKRSKDTLPESSHSDHLAPRNGQTPTGGLAPYEEMPSTPGSTSSSINSASVTHLPSSTLRPSTAASTSSSVSALRKQPFGSEQHWYQEPRKTKAFSGSSPSNHNRQRPFPSSKKSGDLERALPPLPRSPPFPSSYGFASPNGHAFFSEPESILPNGQHHPEIDQPTFSVPPPTSFPEGMKLHQRSSSTNLPPSSMSSSVGANTSSGSNSSSTSGIRKATRKLSLTAPMLGFGRNKDKK